MSDKKAKLLTLSVEGYFSPIEIASIEGGRAMVFLEIEDDGTYSREFDVDKDCLTEVK
tara:strand:- start:289 stop:462 length:174 start_codon:yes stop_codon:yes gene_type:complete